jgi:hypothetical protein
MPARKAHTSGHGSSTPEPITGRIYLVTQADGPLIREGLMKDRIRPQGDYVVCDGSAGYQDYHQYTCLAWHTDGIALYQEDTREFADDPPRVVTMGQFQAKPIGIKTDWQLRRDEYGLLRLGRTIKWPAGEGLPELKPPVTSPVTMPIPNQLMAGGASNWVKKD